MNRPMRFGLSLLTAALLTVVAVAPGAAQDNHPAASGAVGEHAASPPPAERASGTTHEEGGTPAARNADADAIDAHVAPPSHRAHEHVAHVRPIGVPSPRNLLARPRPVFGAPTPTIRNTIGVAVQPGSAGIATHASIVPLSFGRRTKAATVKPVAPANGSLSGTGLAHRTLAPAAIGGPAPAVGGINGSSIRPKHAGRS